MKPKCFSQMNKWTAVLPFTLLITTLWAQYNEGHFRFGLISLEVKDSLTANTMMKDMFENIFSEQSKYDLYFNSQKSSTVVQNEDKTKRIVYDDKKLLNYSFLQVGSEKYYCVDSSVLLLKKQYDTRKTEEKIHEEETRKAKDSLSQLFNISRAPGDLKSIFGFPCVKCEIRNPNDRGTVYSIMYVTDKIPIPEEGFGELAEFFPGCALETTMLIQGFEIKMGALSFEPGIKDKNIFSVKTKGYKKVSSEELDDLMNNE